MESTTATRTTAEPTAEPTTDTQAPAQIPVSSRPGEEHPPGRLRSAVAAVRAGTRWLHTFLRGRPARLMRTLAEQLRTNFELPNRGTTTPHPARLASICAWAALLSLTGLVVAGRAAIPILADTASGWFQPVMVFVGVLGIVLTIGAFAAVGRPRVPWLLLAAATVPLLAGGWLAFSH